MNLENLKEIRLKKGLTQAQISKLVGVSINAYRNWEQGTGEPKEENLERLIEILENKGDK